MYLVLALLKVAPVNFTLNEYMMMMTFSKSLATYKVRAPLRTSRYDPFSCVTVCLCVTS